MILFWIALVTLFFWGVGGAEVTLGSRKIPYLRDLPLDPARPPAPVSIVVAARNEERKIRGGVQSLLDQRNLELELVVVDDRSEDRTGEMLDQLSTSDPRLRVVHIESLPEGWLGKTHALHLGAAVATSKWILFTDADVVFTPDAIARAVGFAERNGIDHLAVTPELQMPTLGSDLFGGTFVLLFSRFSRAWKVRDPSSASYIGIGAFNLLRREVYEAIGGHSRVQLRPDDDLMLGKVVKEAGFRQDVLYGIASVRVEWYDSLGDAIRGLEKNAFAGLRYSAPAVLAAVAALLLFGVWPWMALFVTAGWTLALNAGSVGAMALLYVMSTRSSGARPWLAPLLPVAICIFCYTILRSAVLALWRGEVRWRGTAYPLDELRRYKV